MNTMTAVSFTLATIISSTGASVTNAASVPASFVAGTFKPMERRSTQPKPRAIQSYFRFVVAFQSTMADISAQNDKLKLALSEVFNTLEAGVHVEISEEVELLATSGIAFTQAGIDVCMKAFDKALSDANAREVKILQALRESSIETLEGVITTMTKVTELKKKSAEKPQEHTLVIDLPRMEVALSSDTVNVERKMSRQELRELFSA